VEQLVPARGFVRGSGSGEVEQVPNQLQKFG